MTGKHNGDPIWIDLGTDDMDAAAKFYGELFGWTFNDQGADYGHYHMITLGDRPVGGAMSSLMGPEGPLEEPAYPSAWTVYLATDAIDSTVNKVSDAGGKVHYPAMKVGELGSMAIVEDPAGAAFGLWEPAEFPGLTFDASIGTPVWFETMTKNFDAALPFYRDVLGWTPAMMPGGINYASNRAQNETTAGLCDASTFLPEEVPSFWRAYILVESTDASCEKIKELGGVVLDGPIDSPFGRLATVADPTGAQFQIIEPMNS